MSEEVGGTKIQKRGPIPPQQPPQNLVQQQSPPQQPVYQQPSHQQQHQQSQFQQQQPSQQQLGGNLKKKLNLDNASIKYSIVVVLIFLMLNSKIIWSQISRLPFMGSMEPSLIALVINSILAGVVFYCFKVFVFKD